MLDFKQCDNDFYFKNTFTVFYGGVRLCEIKGSKIEKFKSDFSKLINKYCLS